MSSETDRIIALRERVLRANPTEQSHLRAALREDFAAWCECCAWTYRVKEIDATGRERPVTTPHTPFILWDCQRDAASEIVAAVRDGRDVVVRKTRDMGASWLLCAVSVWGWMFHGWQSLLVSRVEDLVDRTGDPDSLFWKVDYLVAGQPEWLLPAKPERFAKGGDKEAKLQLSLMQRAAALLQDGKPARDAVLAERLEHRGIHGEVLGHEPAVPPFDRDARVAEGGELLGE